MGVRCVGGGWWVMIIMVQGPKGKGEQGSQML
jgi:hypothetical protein